MIRSNVIICVFYFLFHNSFLISQNFTNASLIIILDNTEFLKKKEKYQDFQANEGTLIVALQEKAAPILTSFPVLNSIIKNKQIIEKEERFKDFSNDLQSFVYKKITNNLYLLVPRSYNNIALLKNYVSKNLKPEIPLTQLELDLGLKIDHLETKDIQNIEDEFYIPALSNEFEKSFITNLDSIFVINQEYTKYKIPMEKKPAWAIFLAGHGIIIEKATLSKPKIKDEELELVHKNLVEIQKLWQEINKQQQEFSVEKEESKKIVNIRSQIEKLNAIQNILDAIAQTLNINLVKFAKDYKDMLRSGKTDLDILVKVIEKDQDLVREGFEILIGYFTIEKMTIAQLKLFDNGISNIYCGLSRPYFQSFLSFLDNKIQNKILCFISCFSGGQSLDKLYQSQKDAIQKTFNYLIASAASNESPAITSINILQFNKFFSSLRTDEPIDFEEVLNFIFGFYAFSPEDQKRITFPENLPLLKFPGREWITMIDIPEKIVSIGKTLARSRDPEMPLDISRFFGGRIAKKEKNIQKMIYPEMVLLYTDNIPFPLKFTVPSPKKDKDWAIGFPTLFSMISGNAVHRIAGIDASDFNLSEILKTRFQALEVKKIFIIKKLTAINDINNWPELVTNELLELTNVIFFNYIKDPLGNQTIPHDGLYFTLNGKYYQSWEMPITIATPEEDLPEEDEIPNLKIIENNYLPKWLEIAASIESEKAPNPSSVFSEELSELKKFMQKRPSFKPQETLNDLIVRLKDLQNALELLNKNLEPIK